MFNTRFAVSQSMVNRAISSARRVPIIVLCLVLAAVRIAGTHAHLTPSDHEGAAGSSATIHHVIVTTDEDSPLHLKAHLFHGDIDADDSVQTSAKSSSSSLAA